VICLRRTAPVLLVAPRILGPVTGEAARIVVVVGLVGELLPTITPQLSNDNIERRHAFSTSGFADR